MATCQTEVSADGFDVIRLGNSRISISVLPELGGKIYEITNLKTGREWLWKNPHISLRHPSPGMDYERELDSGGWDEILFSVKPCTLELPGGHSFSIGDHGIVVERAWRNVESGINGAGEAVCELLAEGQSPGFRLKRRIVLDAEQARFEIEYTLNNTGSTSWPWLWCAHPLLAVEKGMRIHLQEGQRIRPVQGDVTDPVSDQTWPGLRMPDGEITDLVGVFEGPGDSDGFCQKLYVQSASEIGLITADGAESLYIQYDPRSLPWLGLWINNNTWSGCDSAPYLNLGIEPATTAHDSLADAVRFAEVDYLGPGESKTWFLTVSLKNGIKTND